MTPTARRKRVVQYAKDGHRPSAICKMIGCAPSTVYGDLRWARTHGHDIPAFSTSDGGENGISMRPNFEPVSKRITVSTPLFEMLCARGAKSGKTAQETATYILQNALLAGGE